MLNNSQQLGMAQNKWFNTKICTHCWVLLGRLGQREPRFAGERQTTTRAWRQSSVVFCGTSWSLGSDVGVSLRTREEHPYGIEQHGNQRITWSHLSGMFSIKHKRFDHQRWRFNQQTCDWTITWTDTRQEWGTRLKHWAKKRQWFQPVVDCGVFCVQPQNFWVNYVLYNYVWLNIYLLNLKITFACSSSQAFLHLPFPQNEKAGTRNICRDLIVTAWILVEQDDVGFQLPMKAHVYRFISYGSLQWYSGVTPAVNPGVKSHHTDFVPRVIAPIFQTFPDFPDSDVCFSKLPHSQQTLWKKIPIFSNFS